MFVTCVLKLARKLRGKIALFSDVIFWTANIIKSSWQNLESFLEKLEFFDEFA